MTNCLSRVCAGKYGTYSTYIECKLRRMSIIIIPVERLVAGLLHAEGGTAGTVQCVS